MSLLVAFDICLAATTIVVAFRTIAVRATFPAIVGYVIYGLLLALVWVRLSAVDVALTEAAIGSGITGVLLLSAASKLRGYAVDLPPPDRRIRVLTAILCGAITAGLAGIVLLPPDPVPTLAPSAMANLDTLQIGNGVAAVLKAYRALDTLLEAVVLLIALVGVWSLASDNAWGGRPAPWRSPAGNDALTFAARTLPPIGILAGIYIVWVGADEPGGAFQGSSILAAMWILTLMAGLVTPPHISATWLRVSLVLGPGVFILVGFAGFLLAGNFLAYPAGFAKPVMVLIEVALAPSIAVTLAMMVAGPPARADES